MSSLVDRRISESTSIRGREYAAAALEVAALLLIFIVAFTGRSTFGPGVKAFLTGLSVAVGLLGSGAGLLTVWRGVQFRRSRGVRLALGAFMAFIGIYTIVHVLS